MDKYVFVTALKQNALAEFFFEHIHTLSQSCPQS